MGGELPGVSTLMQAFDKILAVFNQRNVRGNWLYQTEPNKIPMVDVSAEQAAKFFHTMEVNLNQMTTTTVGQMPATAKVHAVEAKSKWKPKGKGNVSLGEHVPQKAALHQVFH